MSSRPPALYSSQERLYFCKDQNYCNLLLPLLFRCLSTNAIEMLLSNLILLLYHFKIFPLFIHKYLFFKYKTSLLYDLISLFASFGFSLSSGLNYYRNVYFSIFIFSLFCYKPLSYLMLTKAA